MGEAGGQNGERTLTLAPIFLLFTPQTSTPLHTPYASSEPLAIRGATLSSAEVPRLGLEEIVVDAHGTFDNPFDPADVTLDAHVTPPSGKAYDIPGFYSRDFTRRLDNGKEVLTSQGNGKWLVRIAPTEEGSHLVELTFHDRTGTAKKGDIVFRARKAEAPGMIKVSPRDHRFFEYDDGTAYYPIPANVCWGNDRGTYSYDDWLPKYGKEGMNLARLWLSPAWATFAPDTVGKPEAGKGIGEIDLGNAWRLDYVAGLAQKQGIDLQLCIESYNILRDQDNANFWEKTPQNSDNGGPLRIWTEFWKLSEMDRLFKLKLRYLVARYSAYSNVFAWELWNEVDQVRNFDPDLVQAWHQRMASELHRIDPYGHLVTTSLADPMGNRDLELIPELDFFQTHLYNAPDLVKTMITQQYRKAWGRPHLVGEIGEDATGPRGDDDPTGIQIHDPQWASMAAGGAGSASPWWWDNYIDPKNLYPLFGAIARFSKGIDWPGEAFQIANLTFAYQSKPVPALRRDLNLDGGPVTWQAGGANIPKTVGVTPQGATGQLPVAGILHGLKNHPNMHNPIRFKFSAPRATRLDVVVGDVSGYGGATLRVEVDGARLLTRDFPDPDGDRDGKTLTNYRGVYSVTIPAGNHTILVENIGRDWMLATYRFKELVTKPTPPIQGWAMVGNDTIVGWFRPEGRTWARLCAQKEPAPTCPPTVFGIAGLAAGTWKLEYWDTWKGEVTGTQNIQVGLTGKARVPLPKIDSDLAIKMVRTTPLR